MKRKALIPVALAVAVLAGIGLTRLNVSADTSGPNGSGYVWVDTNSPSPTTDFNYIDISGTGTALDHSDDSSDNVPLPFNFTYFGVEYTGDILISSNGFLSFNTDDPNDCGANYNWDDTITSPNGDDAGFPIPHGDADCEDDGWGPNPLIAVWFTDHDPSECDSNNFDTYYETQGDMFIVQWVTCNNNDPNSSDECSVDFEVILFEGSNDIKFQYSDTVFSCDDETHYEDDGAYATVGLNEGDVNGLQYSWNEPVLDGELAILWTTGDVEEPTAEPTDCIPGIPGSRCGSEGGGGGAGDQTPLATATPIPVAIATVAPPPPPAPTLSSGGQQGVITAPDTGTGPSGSGSANRLGLAAVLLTMGALAVTGGSLAFARRR